MKNIFKKYLIVENNIAGMDYYILSKRMGYETELEIKKFYELHVVYLWLFRFTIKLKETETKYRFGNISSIIYHLIHNRDKLKIAKHSLNFAFLYNDFKTLFAFNDIETFLDEHPEWQI